VPSDIKHSPPVAPPATSSEPAGQTHVLVVASHSDPSGCVHEQPVGGATKDTAPGGHAVHPGGSPVGLQKLGLHWQTPATLDEPVGHALKHWPPAHVLLTQSLLDAHAAPLFLRHTPWTSTLSGSSQMQALAANDHVAPAGHVQADAPAVDVEPPPHMTQGDTPPGPYAPAAH